MLADTFAPCQIRRLKQLQGRLFLWYLILPSPLFPGACGSRVMLDRGRDFSTDVENYVENRAPSGGRSSGKPEIARLAPGESARDLWGQRFPPCRHAENGCVQAPRRAKGHRNSQDLGVRAGRIG
jgi:hypothetical protein